MCEPSSAWLLFRLQIEILLRILLILRCHVEALRRDESLDKGPWLRLLSLLLKEGAPSSRQTGLHLSLSPARGLHILTIRMRCLSILIHCIFICENVNSILVHAKLQVWALSFIERTQLALRTLSVDSLVLSLWLLPITRPCVVRFLKLLKEAWLHKFGLKFIQ